MTTAPLLELKRIAESVDRLRDQVVDDVTVRSDCRQLRITLADGQILLVSARTDESGRARLDVDVLRAAVDGPQRQLEVRFDGS